VDLASRTHSEAALREEISWSIHLGVFAVVAPPMPEGKSCVHYAQALNSNLLRCNHLPVWQEVAFEVSQV
jgi:hypothetical protein